jgi:hypothetical protein
MSSLKRGRDIANENGMQSLGTDGETQKHALLKPTLTAVPSLLYPAWFLRRAQRSDPQTSLLHIPR